MVISTEFIYLSPVPFSLLRAPTKGLVRARLGESQTILLLTWDAHASQIPRIHTFLPNLLLPLFLVDNILTHRSFRLETPICLMPLLPTPCLIGCPCMRLSNAFFLSLVPLSQPWVSASSCAVNCCPGRQFLCPLPIRTLSAFPSLHCHWKDLSQTELSQGSLCNLLKYMHAFC